MTTKYVSVARGSDSTGNGSAATPWATIDKAIGSGAAFTLDSANPNFLYIEPGIYRESVGVGVGVTPTSAGPLSIVGDTDGAGFAGGGYSTPAVGLVEWRAWSDDVTPIANNCLFVGPGKDYVTIGNIKFIGGDTTTGAVYVAGNTNFTMRDCNLIGYYAASKGTVFRIEPTAGTPPNFTLDRCEFWTTGGGAASISLGIPANASDWSLVGSEVVNCTLSGVATGVFVEQYFGSGSFAAGGVAFQNCTFRNGGGYGIYCYYPSGTTTNAFTVNGCAFLGCSIHAEASGQIVENGNVFLTSTTRDNVSTGANTVTAACPAFSINDERMVGLPPRPFGEPSAVSPFNGFGAYGTVPAVDMTGRNRPEGTGSTAPAVGALERHDTGTKDTTYQDTGSSACMALIGPSSQERLILVDAVSTTLSVKVRWDGNHGDTNKPQAILVAEPQIGVSGQTVTATSSGGTGSTPNSYETLTFSAFTPTAKGAVTLRMVSRAAAGNGTAYFDSISL